MPINKKTNIAFRFGKDRILEISIDETPTVSFFIFTNHFFQVKSPVFLSHTLSPKLQDIDVTVAPGDSKQLRNRQVDLTSKEHEEKKKLRNAKAKKTREENRRIKDMAKDPHMGVRQTTLTQMWKSQDSEGSSDSDDSIL